MENIQYITAEEIETPTPSNNSNALNTIGYDSSFEERIVKYVDENKPVIAILTPCYGGMCYTPYVSCLIKTLNLCNYYKIKVNVLFCRNDSLVTRARNNLIAKALTTPDITHILFIDSDISWNELDILKLLLSDKSVVGGVYPLKKYNWDLLFKDPNNPYNSNVVQSVVDKVNKTILKNSMSNEDIIQAHLLKYNLNYLESVMNIENNLAKVKHIANGFMMLKRNVLTQLMDANPQLKYVDDTGFLEENEHDYAYALFNSEVAYGHYLSEDWLFCDRWTNIGGEVFIDVTINLTHSGNVDFKGNFLSSIL